MLLCPSSHHQERKGGRPHRFFISFKAYQIPSGAMEPALLVGDYFVSDVRFFRHHKPQRGDIVIFLYPPDRTKDFVVRVRDVIAKPLYVYWAKDRSRIGMSIR